MSGKRYKEVHKVPYFLCDRKDELTVPMLVNFIILISGNQSEALEIDETVFDENGYSWIVLQYEFDIHRMPKNKEKIEIETVAVAYNKLFCYRDFYVYDEKGRKLVTVRSIFALMNQKTRKIIRIPEEVIAPYQAKFEKRIRRTPQPESYEAGTAAEMKKTYNVRYFDIDLNDHVNNSQYLSWVLDALPSEFLAEHQITHGNIKFNKEVYENEVVDSYAKLTESTEEITSLHKISTNSKENCTAELVWKKCR